MQSLMHIILCTHKLVPNTNHLKAHLNLKTILIFFNATGTDEEERKKRSKNHNITKQDEYGDGMTLEMNQMHT